eukprot:scaffold10679_cov139-Isochrysis_galbana.AAC.4
MRPLGTTGQARLYGSGAWCVRLHALPDLRLVPRVRPGVRAQAARGRGGRRGERRGGERRGGGGGGDLGGLGMGCRRRSSRTKVGWLGRDCALSARGA